MVVLAYNYIVFSKRDRKSRYKKKKKEKETVDDSKLLPVSRFNIFANFLHWV